MLDEAKVVAGRVVEAVRRHEPSLARTPTRRPLDAEARLTAAQAMPVPFVSAAFKIAAARRPPMVPCASNSGTSASSRRRKRGEATSSRATARKSPSCAAASSDPAKSHAARRAASASLVPFASAAASSERRSRPVSRLTVSAACSSARVDPHRPSGSTRSSASWPQRRDDVRLEDAA